MTTQSKKRGRPKTEKTLERERIEEMLRNPPSHIRDSKRTPIIFDHKQAEAIEKQMLKDHKSPPMPASIVFAIESAGPEFMDETEIQATVAEYTRVAKNIYQGQIAGGKKLADRAAERIEQVLKRNPDIAEKVASGAWRVNRGAMKIYDEWDKRGDGLQRPSVRNITRWLNIFLAKNINSLDKAIF